MESLTHQRSLTCCPTSSFSTFLITSCPPGPHLPSSRNTCPSSPFSMLGMSRIISCKELRSNIYSIFSSNRLQLPESPETLRKSFENVRELLLNRMDYDWTEVSRCCEIFTELHTLNVCFNNITTISSLSARLDRLTSLSLEGNLLAGWDSVLTFSHLQQSVKQSWHACT